MKKIVNGIEIELTPEESSAIKAEWKRSDKERARKSWLYGRASEYPSISDQLDMIFHAIEDGVPLNESEFFAEIKRIKEKYPKLD